MPEIVVVGSSNTDMVVKTPRFPEPGETILGGDFFMFPGGKGANQAVAAARAGGEVVFIAAVGDDAYGAEAIKGYKEDQINTEDIKICKGVPSGVAMITVSHQGENAIAVASGANAELSPADLEEAEEAFVEAEYMLVQLETPMETVQKAVELCAECDTRVVLNPAPAAELTDAILEKVHILTPNETEAETLTGIEVKDEASAADAAETLHKRGVDTVIITLGSKGAYLSDQPAGKQILVPGFRVRAMDTTAAGDVFNGQLVVSLNEGLDMERAIHRAHAAAALSVQKMGAQSSIPRREETERFLEEQHRKIQ